MKKQYSFITKWAFEAPLAAVWEAIYKSEEWPEWWKGVVSVKEHLKGDELGIGSIREYVLESPIKYRLKFSLLLTDRKELELLKGNASGELEGTGAWYFRHSNGITYAECHWHVATTLPWMNTFAFLLKPLFSYNHGAVMKQGARCLAKKLSAKLVSGG